MSSLVLLGGFINRFSSFCSSKFCFAFLLSMWWVSRSVASAARYNEPDGCDISNKKVVRNVRRAVVLQHTNHSSPPVILHSLYVYPPLPPPPWSVSPLSNVALHVCSRIPSSGIRCRRSGKSWRDETGWQKTSRHRSLPPYLHTRRLLAFKGYTQHEHTDSNAEKYSIQNLWCKHRHTS